MSYSEGTGASPDPCHLVRTVWETARPANGGLPTRRDIGALSIAGALHGTFLLTRDKNLGWRFRFAGRDLVEMTGLDLHGMAGGTIFEREARDRVAAWLEATHDEPARTEFPVATDALYGPVRGRMLLLPLADGHGSCPLVIGAVALDRVPREAPCRLTVGPARVVPVSGGTVVRLAMARPDRPSAPVAGGRGSLHSFMG